MSVNSWSLVKPTFVSPYFVWIGVAVRSVILPRSFNTSSITEDGHDLAKICLCALSTSSRLIVEISGLIALRRTTATDLCQFPWNICEVNSVVKFAACVQVTYRLARNRRGHLAQTPDRTGCGFRSVRQTQAASNAALPAAGLSHPVHATSSESRFRERSSVG